MAATVIDSSTPKKQKLDVIGTRIFHDTQSIVAGGPSVYFNSNKLSNSFGWPMLLDEIRFDVSGTSTTGGTNRPVSAVPLSCRIAIGKRKLHNTMTPILLTCKPNDRILTNYQYQNMGPSGSVEVGGVTWRLDKPLTMMPGDTLAVEVQYPPLVPALGSTDQATPYSVSVTGIGRLVRQVPKRRWTPFVSAWVPDYVAASTINGAPVTVRSKAADLYNPFDSPLFVKDVLGLGTIYLTAGEVVPAVQNINDTYYLGLATEGCAVQIVNSGAFADGVAAVSNAGIRSYVPFYHAFLPQTRAWRMNAAMRPRSFLQARLQQVNWSALIVDGPDGLTGANPGQYYVRFAIAMIGYAQDES